VNALECINRLVSSLDKMIIIDDIIPFLTEIQCSDADIIMAVLGTVLQFSRRSFVSDYCDRCSRRLSAFSGFLSIKGNRSRPRITWKDDVWKDVKAIDTAWDDVCLRAMDRDEWKQ